MSREPTKTGEAVTILTLKKAKREGRKISMVTCYDATFARLIDQSSIDCILVGDSLGNVIMGLGNTLGVTMEHMIHHTRAVSRGAHRPLLCADMPFLSYHISPEQALTNAGRLIAEGGAACVKLEGGEEVVPQIEKIVSAGIPLMGHIGLTPQSIHAIGGYKVRGKGDEEARKMMDDALKIEAAGAFALVLEMVPAHLSEAISKRLSIPTIGIGAGGETDGQVLVLHDLLGLDAQFNPKFLKKYMDGSHLVLEALRNYDTEVKQQKFPGVEHSFL